MRQITIALPDGLYAELESASAAMCEPNYGADKFACDIVASDLASRRLSRVTPGKCGGRVQAKAREPETYRLLLPERA